MTTFQRARSEEQREVRRQAILGAAAAMLAEMPVAQVTLNELSRRAGLAKSNVLRYFESREAVLLELLDSAWQDWLARLDQELAAGCGTGPAAAVRPDQRPGRRAGAERLARGCGPVQAGEHRGHQRVGPPAAAVPARARRAGRVPAGRRGHPDGQRAVATH